MKKNPFIIVVAVVIFIFLSCHENTEKTEENALPRTDSVASKPVSAKKINLVKDCSGIGNLVIGKEEADTMIKNYMDIYMHAATTGRHLTQSVWIDANVIIAFANLFDHQAKYDGARFINAVKNDNQETRLILVPTIEVDPTGPDKSGHINDWVNVNLPNNESVEFLDFNLGLNKTIAWKSSFDRLYKTVPEDDSYCLSSSVWISDCVFFALRDLIKDPNNEIDGVRVLLAAYSDKRYSTTNPSQKAEKQSTIILVPTTKSGIEHTDDWNIIKTKTDFDEKFRGAYNHGQLCPQICE